MLLLASFTAAASAFFLATSLARNTRPTTLPTYFMSSSPFWFLGDSQSPQHPSSRSVSRPSSQPSGLPLNP